MPKVAVKKKRAKPVTDWRPAYKRLTKRQMRDVLVNLADSGNVTEACSIAKANRRAVYARAADDEDFGQAFAEAKHLGKCGLEDEAGERAYDREEEYYSETRGKMVKKTRYGSDTLLMFLIKAHDPSFREGFDLKLGGPAGAPLHFNVTFNQDAIKEAQG